MPPPCEATLPARMLLATELGAVERVSSSQSPPPSPEGTEFPEIVLLRMVNEPLPSAEARTPPPRAPTAGLALPVTTLFRNVVLEASGLWLYTPAPWAAALPR